MRTNFTGFLARLGERLHGFRLRNRARIGDVEGVADRGRLIQRAQAGLHQILDVDELHQPAAVAGQNDGAVRRAGGPRKNASR